MVCYFRGSLFLSLVHYVFHDFLLLSLVFVWWLILSFLVVVALLSLPLPLCLNLFSLLVCYFVRSFFPSVFISVVLSCWLSFFQPFFLSSSLSVLVCCCVFVFVCFTISFFLLLLSLISLSCYFCLSFSSCYHSFSFGFPSKLRH